MTGFSPKHPVVVDLCNGKWRLHEPIRYTAPDGRQWTMPEGLETDFGSIPNALEWIPGLEPWGTEGDAPYILHDYLYACNRAGKPECRDRKDADQILYDALRLCGVGRVRAGVIYYGVRVGGWVAWERSR